VTHMRNLSWNKVEPADCFLRQINPGLFPLEPSRFSRGRESATALGKLNGREKPMEDARDLIDLGVGRI